ncbi:hypothetical protein ACJ73_06461 [Blastomyces percursus]|uniref:Uncharacterized protein n=1 Tax=Blastomyces percursus TaxID=1658174 RepID=A0A1J9Q279_9EURO|nr:hypothetical protein ACJ73_06461 [Blastomyces percursus]
MSRLLADSYLTDDQSIEPPSLRLLAIHRASAHILRRSRVGKYINNILRDMEGIGVRADASTELGRIMKLRLGGWLDRAVGAHA